MYQCKLLPSDISKRLIRKRDRRRRLAEVFRGGRGAGRGREGGREGKGSGVRVVGGEGEGRDVVRLEQRGQGAKRQV